MTIDQLILLGAIFLIALCCADWVVSEINRVIKHDIARKRATALVRKLNDTQK